MSLRTDLKAVIKQSGQTMKSVNETLNQQNGTDYSLVNLSKKFTNETLRYTEVAQILDIIGYDILWQKRTER